VWVCIVMFPGWLHCVDKRLTWLCWLLCMIPAAGIRSRCLCAQGDLVGAVAVARHGLAPAQHDSIASFLHLQGGLPGAHLALMGLQGLSMEMEAELCMATGAVQGPGEGGADSPCPVIAWVCKLIQAVC
jgi:hypothetical protein